MIKKRRLISFVMVIVLALSLSSMAFAVSEGAKGDIIILTTNDVHNTLKGDIGYAGLVAYRTAMEGIVGKGNVTLIDAGDSIAGGVIGALSKGDYLIDIMNYVGYDLAIPGNHEFDFGMERFLELAGKAEFPYISCNFVDLLADKTVFDAYKIIEYGDVKVAYIGITTPETFFKSTPAYFQDENGEYIYGLCEGSEGEELYAQVQKTIDDAKKAGADYVIAVAHLGIDEGSRPWTSIDVVANTVGLDAIIDGHSHSEIDGVMYADKDGNEIPCVQTGAYLANIGKIVITPGKGIEAGLVTPADIEDMDADADTEAFIESIEAQYTNIIEEVVATTDVALTTLYPDSNTRAVRSDETNLGDLCADAYRSLMGSDIAFVNGGGVRANINVGEIKLKDIIDVHPFGNMACLVEVTGQQVLDALEMGVKDAPGESGGFLQVSGISYKVDATIKSTVEINDKGEFVAVNGARRVSDVLVGGAPIDADKTYTLAGHNYMLKQGGDGFSMFKGSEVLKDEIMVDNQVLITYITEVLGGVVGEEYSNPRGQGRVQITALYDDIKTSEWYYTSVKATKDKGLMIGVSDTQFAPNADFTRAMLVTILYRAAGAKAEPGDAFDDVDAGAWYAEAVAWALENEIIVGDGTGNFRPNEAISRQEMAVLIYNYYGYLGLETEGSELTYDDSADIADWAAFAVAFCLKEGIMTGDNNMFNPEGSSTRAEGAAVLSRIKLPEPPAEAA